MAGGCVSGDAAYPSLYYSPSVAARAVETGPRRQLSSRFLAKQFIQVGGSSVIGEQVECAVCFNVLSGAQKRAPCRKRKAGAYGDTAHTDVSQLRKRELMIES